MNRRTDWIVPLAAASIAVLATMVAITVATGVSQETFEIARHPAVYTAELRAYAAPLRALFGLDSAFLVLYSTLLVLFARRLATPDTRAMLAIAIGGVLATAVLDMVEDHHILAMLRGAERGVDATAAQIAFQHALSQVKFHLSYLALFLLGLHVPRRTRAGTVLAWLLTAGTLAQGGCLYAAPDDLLPAGNMGRWLGFLVGFALIIQVTRRAGDAAATGAPA
jgi:hypothetical protein